MARCGPFFLPSICARLCLSASIKSTTGAAFFGFSTPTTCLPSRCALINVKELIKAHLEGKHVVGVEKPKKAAPVVDLMDALKQSLAQMEGKKKGPQRAIEYQRGNQVRISDEPQA